MTQLQKRLLARAAAKVRPEGLLVYAVCSLEPAAGPSQVSEFLAAHPAFRRFPVEPREVGDETQFITADGDLRTLPCHWAERGGVDGFYATRLTRS
jgi:16S rRNA (cytosine967-C5)-methyltransferase